MAMAKRLFGALVPVLCTVACGQTVVPSGAVADAGAVPLADAGFDGGASLDAGAPVDAGPSVLDDPNLAPFDSTLQRGPKDWVSGSGPVLLEVGISGPSVGVPPFSITRSPITNREFAQCVRAGACEVDLVSDKNCRDTTVFRDANYEVLNHLAWIFRNTTLKRALWDAPATCLKYEQAEKYCAWIGAQLPTVPQFVFAARGTYGEPVRRYPWGNTQATWVAFRARAHTTGLHRVRLVGGRRPRRRRLGPELALHRAADGSRRASLRTESGRSVRPRAGSFRLRRR
jgi:hypothetical protein